MPGGHGMVEIDGAYGEGGGQLLRTAVALSAITGRPARVANIRAGRPSPGLAAQHVTAVRAVAELCGASVSGLALRSRALRFAPGVPRAGAFSFDVGTAGSAVLVLQALMPVAAALRLPCRVRITGGTDVRGAPGVDYMQAVLLPLLAEIGLKASIAVQRRGYFPGGGGELEAEILPGDLQPLRLGPPAGLLRIRGRSHVGNLPPDIAERMRASTMQALVEFKAPIDIEAMALDQQGAAGQGGAITVWAQAANSFVGACRVAERGVRAETLGAEAGCELREDLNAAVALDVHAADQVLIYLALAGGESGFTTRRMSSHATTAMWLIEQFLPAKFDTAEIAGKIRVRVRPGS
jgi:RNA 3'-terminal phosphate cyclase (ATP)